MEKEILFKDSAGVETDVIELNMGPQHPATHGVLRIKLWLDGETVVKARVMPGYLHRGTEKIAEHKTFHQILPYTDRLDYLAPLTNNLAYVMAVEKLLGLEVPERAKYIRTMLAELTRIESHLVWYASHGMDLGAWTAWFYGFREREKIYDLLEILTGQRMNNTYMRVGGVAADLNPQFITGLTDFIAFFKTKAMSELHTMLTENIIWKKRTQGVGLLTREDVLALSATGPVARGSGLDHDMRRDEPYLVYDRLGFRVPVYNEGDSYARYLVRMEEMEESVKMIEQCLTQLPKGPVLADEAKVIPPPKDQIYDSMENLLHHFRIVSDGFPVPEGEAMVTIEAPKGELGFYVVSDGSSRPYRLHIRASTFINLQTLEKMAVGGLIADVITLIGTLDVVLGEVDR